MDTAAARTELITSTAYRFTIREIGRGDLRKHMNAERFLAKRGQYVGREGIRVDVTDTRDDSVQCWNLALTRWFG